MTAEQQRHFGQLRADFQKAIQDDGRREPLDYSTTNDFEFLSATVEQFYANPYRIQEVSPGLYDFYREYFGIDPTGFVDPSSLADYTSLVDKFNH